MSWNPSLTLTNVEIVRGHKTLISGLSLTLDQPQLLWVEGGNGIGKTSLLRTCAGLSRPASGHVEWTIDAQSCAAPDCIGFLPSAPYAKPALTVQEEAEFWNSELDVVNLSQHAGTRTERLSTGQSKRLSLAKLIAGNKAIWILDEPLAGLDEDGREDVAKYLSEHFQRGGIALVASHAPIAVDDVLTRRLSLQ